MSKRFLIGSGHALVLMLIAVSCSAQGADARPRHRVRFHQLFVEEPRPPTPAETTAYDVGQLSGFLVEGIGGATSALPAPSYPRSYGDTPRSARPAHDVLPYY